MTARRLRVRSATLVVVAMLTLASCEETSTGNGDDGTAQDGIPRVELSADEQVGYEALMTDLLGPNGLSGRLGGYWPAAYSEMVIGSQYRQPRAVTAYEGASQPSGCGPLSVGNAWYCPADESIYYDDNLFRWLYRDLGMAGPTIILAHEWGHHVQQVMVAPSVSVQAELQADCFAGMFFGMAMQPPPGEPDLRAAGATLFIIGDKDYRASEWFEPDVHGPPSWRAKAFLDGMLGDGAYCRDYGEWEERGTYELGVYRWLPAPGLEISRGQGDVLIAELRGRTAYIASYGAPGADTTALAHLPTAFHGWFGGGATPIGSPVAIETGEGVGGILGGTGAVQGYQYTDAAGVLQHGVFFLHVATTGDAAVVSVVQPGTAPNAELTDPVWDPLLNYMFVVGYSLCPPDGAGALCIALGGD